MDYFFIPLKSKLNSEITSWVILHGHLGIAMQYQHCSTREDFPNDCQLKWNKIYRSNWSNICNQVKLNEKSSNLLKDTVRVSINLIIVKLIEKNLIQSSKNHQIHEKHDSIKSSKTLRNQVKLNKKTIKFMKYTIQFSLIE